MRITRFIVDGTARLGVCVGEEVIDLTAAAPALPSTLAALLAAGPDALDRVREVAERATQEARRPLRELTLLPPAGEVGKILCLGLNYLDHVGESTQSRPVAPQLFMRASSSLIGAGAPIRVPAISEQLDFEGELAAIIGRRGRAIPLEEALSFVAGFSIFNDASIRDYQFQTSQWTMGKNFDGTGAFGPFMVSADELPPGAAGLKLETRLNGQIVQSADTSDMLFDVATTIALVSQGMTLEPGDVLVMGTPAGVGVARTPKLWMKDGDLCEIEIEGIGVLASPVRDDARLSGTR